MSGGGQEPTWGLMLEMADTGTPLALMSCAERTSREVVSDFCSPVLICAVAGVLQDPSDASLFSSSSRESHHGAAGEFGCQCMEMVPSKPGMA